MVDDGGPDLGYSTILEDISVIRSLLFLADDQLSVFELFLILALTNVALEFILILTVSGEIEHFFAFLVTID